MIVVFLELAVRPSNRGIISVLNISKTYIFFLTNQRLKVDEKLENTDKLAVLVRKRKKEIQFFVQRELLCEFEYKQLYRLHTAIMNRPLSSAATMEVQGPDTT